jgi:hypothetical protein
MQISEMKTMLIPSLYKDVALKETDSLGKRRINAGNARYFSTIKGTDDSL